MSQMSRIIRQLFLVFAGMLCVFVIALVAVHCIPYRWTQEHVSTSVEELEQYGLNYRIGNFELYKLDTYTDCVMLNEVICADGDAPLYSAMANNYYLIDGDELGPEMLENLKAAHDNQGNGENLYSYSRYWHGYLVLLRPLLVLTDYHGIRTINLVWLSLLSLALIVLLWRKAGKYAAITFAVCVAIINPYVISRSMPYATCFSLAFLGMLVLLMRPAWFASTRNTLTLLMVIGSLTAYMDLLSTPLLTAIFPIATLIIYIRPKHVMRDVVLAFTSWGMGYAATWAAKWALCAVLTDIDVFVSATRAIALRTSTLDLDYMFAEKFGINIDGSVFIVAVSAFVLIFVFGLFLLYRHSRTLGRETEQRSLALLLTAMSVPVWFALIRNHSFFHLFFTWRVFTGFLWCILLYICTSLKKTALPVQQTKGLG